MAKKEWPQKWKDSAAKYNNEHYSVIGTKLTREKADQFRTLCKLSGVSVSAALSVFVRAAIQAGTLDIIRGDIPWTRNDDGTTAAGSCRDDDGRRDDPQGQKNVDSAFRQGDQANENDTHGTVDSHPGFDTPGTVD